MSYTFSSSGDNNDLNIFQNSSNSTVSENAVLSDGQSVSLVAMQNNIATNTADISSMNAVTTLSLGIGMGATSNEGIYFPTMLDEELMRLSHGKMRATLFVNPNSVSGLGPGGSGTGEVSNGLVDATLIWANFVVGGNISSLPANGLSSAYTGLTALELNEYYTSEQGRKDYEVIYADTSFVGLPACQIGPEAFGWSKTEITSLADMKDLSSIRMPGQPDSMLGTIARNIYGSNVVSAGGGATALGVSNETFDFWEWNGLPGDEAWLTGNSPSALQKLKSGTSYNYYYPQSVPQETLLADVIMTKTRFNTLTEQEKLWLREACSIVSTRFYDMRLHKGIEIENKIRNPSNTEWSSTIQIQDTPLDIIEAFKAETVRLLDLAATTDISLSLMLNKLKDFAKRKATNTRVTTLESNVTTLTNEKTDLQYQALFNTYGRELYELTSKGAEKWQTQDPSGYELFGDPSAGLVGNLLHFRKGPFAYPRCLTQGFLKPYTTDFSATVVNNSYALMNAGHLATNGRYVVDASATQPTSRTRLQFNDFLPVSENTFNGTNPFGVYKPLNNGSDIKGEIFENDMIGNTAILSKVPYKNYVLEFDFKHTNSAAYQGPGYSSVNGINSGIFFHCQNNPNNKEHSYIAGSWYQVQNRLKIDTETGSNDLSNGRASHNIGAVFGGTGLKLPTELVAKTVNSNGVFQCNKDLSLSDAFYTTDTHFKLTVDASSLEVEISGVQVTWYDSVNEISINKITTLGLNSGYVGFELEESGIEVKNIYISPLPSA